MSKKQKVKKKFNLYSMMDVLVPVVCAILFLIAGIQLMKIYETYNAAKQEYDQLEAQFVENSGAMDLVGEPIYVETQEEYKNRPHFLDLNIDFASLHEVNSDVVGWIYVPSLEISYPVVQGEDNEFYLHHTYEGTQNSCGSIFLDCDSASDMTDRNTFVYGHNMRNGSMFGSLKKFRQDPTLVDANPYVYYYKADHAYKYKIFAFYITQVGSNSYFNFMSDAQYDKYIQNVQTKNEYKNGVNQEFPTRKNILTLSTCSGNHSPNRMVTHAVLIDDYVIERE